MWSAAHLFVRVFTRLNDGKHCVLTTLDKQGDGVRFTVVSDAGELYESLQSETNMDVHRKRVCASLGVPSITWLAFFEMVQQSFVDRNLALREGAPGGSASLGGASSSAGAINAVVALSGFNRSITGDDDDNNYDTQSGQSGTLTSNAGIHSIGMNSSLTSIQGNMLDGGSFDQMNQPELILTINVKPLSQMSTAEAKTAPITLSLRRAVHGKTGVARLSADITAFIGLRTGDRREMEKVEDLLRNERVVRNDAVTARESYDILMQSVSGLQMEIDSLERELELAASDMEQRIRYEIEQQDEERKKTINNNNHNISNNTDETNWRKCYEKFLTCCEWEKLILHIEDPLKRKVKEMCSDFGAATTPSIIPEPRRPPFQMKRSTTMTLKQLHEAEAAAAGDRSDPATAARDELIPGVVPGLICELRKTCLANLMPMENSYQAFLAPSPSTPTGATASSSSDTSSNGSNNSLPNQQQAAPDGSNKKLTSAKTNLVSFSNTTSDSMLSPSSSANIFGAGGANLTSTQIIAVMHRFKDFSDPDGPSLAAQIYEPSSEETDVLQYLTEWLGDWKFNVYHVESMCVRAFAARLDEQGLRAAAALSSDAAGAAGSRRGRLAFSVDASKAPPGPFEKNLFAPSCAAAAAAAAALGAAAAGRLPGAAAHLATQATSRPASAEHLGGSANSVCVATTPGGDNINNSSGSSAPSMPSSASSSFSNHSQQHQQQQQQQQQQQRSHEQNPLAPPGALFYIGYVVFFKLGLIKMFSISERKLIAWLRAVEMGYRQTGAPFHSSVRAADVLQAVYCLITADTKRQVFTDRYILILVLAAILLHYGHPGNFDAAQLPQSIVDAHGPVGALQRHHAAAGFALFDLPQYDILDQVSDASRRMIREYVGNVIVAADLGSHDSTMQALRVRMSAMDLPAFLQTESCLFLALVVKLGGASFCARDSDCFANAVRDLLAESAGRSSLLECGDCVKLLHPQDVENVVPKASDGNVSALLNLINTVALPMFAMMGEIFASIRLTGQNILANKSFASSLRKSDA